MPAGFKRRGKRRGDRGEGDLHVMEPKTKV